MAWSRWLKRFAGVSVAGIATATLASSACVEAEARFYVECVSDLCGCDDTQIPEGSFNAAACEFDEAGEPTGDCGYTASFVLTNQMISSLDFEANNNEVETSEIIIYSADITFESNGGDFQDAIGATLLAAVPPEASICLPVVFFAGNPGVGVGEVVNVIATVKFYGRTTGGLEVETPEQFFPITIYNDPFDCECGGAVPGSGSNGTKVGCATGCDE